MEGKRTIHSIKLKNILSFGSEEQEIELQPLNVLIGPNASGKSNFIEIFRLLRALPTNPAQAIREGGGVEEWLWKGGEPTPVAGISLGWDQGNYRLEFSQAGYRWEITDESIFANDPEQPLARRDGSLPHDLSLLSTFNDKTPAKDKTPAETMLSIWAEMVAPSLTNALSSIGIYREINTGRFSPMKSAHRPDLPGRSLLEDLSNFGLVFNNLPSGIKQEITEQLNQIYDGIQEVSTKIEGGTVQTYIQEKGLSSPTPLTRVSDGTLRFLFLLTLLNQPEIPPLLCIDEPDHGLHPDVIHKIAELLISSSERTQLIVTTHSPQLVSALSDIPETVIVCERDERGTQMRRLEAEPLQGWLERYSLGDLWLKGELGGTRW